MMCQSENRSSIPLGLIEQIAAIIDSSRKLSNRELLTICRDCGVDGFATDPHLCHEIAETAFNHLISTKYGTMLLDSPEPGAACSDVIRSLQKRLPTQTWRSTNQMTYQQFSTPAPIAYLAAYLLNMNDEDTVLEPSCGTGSLAVWARSAGANVITNEIDPRRQQLARMIGFDPTGHDAEFIDDFLAEDIAPSVVLMNPPFSSSGGRVERNRNAFGFRHVESALRRLEGGGRFAVILGEAGSPDNISGRRLWDLMSPGMRVIRSISLHGREFYRNGTTVDITLILGRKLLVSEPRSHVPFCYETRSFDSVEDAFEAIGSK